MNLDKILRKSTFASAMLFYAGAMPAQTTPQIVAAANIATWNDKAPLQPGTINSLWGPFGITTDCVATTPFRADSCPGVEVKVDGIAVPVQYAGKGDGTNNQINFLNLTSSANPAYQLVVNGVPSNTFTHAVENRPLWLRTFTTDNFAGTNIKLLGTNIAANHYSNQDMPNGSILNSDDPLQTHKTDTAVTAYFSGCTTSATPTAGAPTSTQHSIKIDGIPATITGTWETEFPGVCSTKFTPPAGLAAGAHDATISDGDTAGFPTINNNQPYLGLQVVARNHSVLPTSPEDVAKNAPSTKFHGTLDGQPITTDASGNLLVANIADTTHTVVWNADVSNNAARYTVYTTSGTLAQLKAERTMLLKQYLLDARANFRLDRDAIITDARYPEATIWPADPKAMMNSSEFALYSTSTCSFQPGTTFNQCEANGHKLHRWALPNIQTFVDKTYLGTRDMTVAPGLKLPASEAVDYTMAKNRINGQAVSRITTTPDETQPLLKVLFTTGPSNAASRFDSKTFLGISGEAYVFGDLVYTATMNHEIIHNLGLFKHTPARIQDIFKGQEAEFLNTYRGTFGPFIQATLDGMYMSPPGYDMMKDSVPDNAQSEALTIYANGPTDYTIAYPAGARTRESTLESQIFGTADFLIRQLGNAAEAPTLRRQQSDEYAPQPRIPAPRDNQPRTRYTDR
jgi:uncharacterized protein (TIGR03437 family)